MIQKIFQIIVAVPLFFSFNLTTQAQSQTPTLDPEKVMGLRVLLNDIERSHVDLAILTLETQYDGTQIGDHDVDMTPKFTALATLLDKNSQSLADAIGSVYGNDAGTAFASLWKEHIVYFVNYVEGVKTNNVATKDKAQKDLENYSEKAADFLAKANPFLNKEMLTRHISRHVVLLKESVESYINKDYQKAYAFQNEAYMHVGQMADMITVAIIRQFPQKFS